MADRENASMNRDRLEAAVGSLEAMPRAVLLMLSLEGLDYGEIGRRIGISPLEVERHLATALCHLHAVLYGGDGSGTETRG